RPHAPCVLGSSKGDAGHTHAASGMVSLLKAVLTLSHRVLPPVRNLHQARAGLAGARTLLPHTPSPWVRDRSAGPRRAAIASFGIDGGCAHGVIEEAPAAAAAAIPPVRVESVLGEEPPALFAVEGDDPGTLAAGLEALRGALRSAGREDLARAGRAWLAAHPLDAHRKLAVTLAGNDPRGLMAASERALAVLRESDSARQAGDSAESRSSMTPREGGAAAPPEASGGTPGGRFFHSPRPLSPGGDLAFLFPGSGNHYPGMGRELFLGFPGILERLDRENLNLRGQMLPERFWAEGRGLPWDARDLIQGQVGLGTAVSDLVRAFGVEPRTVIGYSLGETAGYFALRAWRDRDGMLERMLCARRSPVGPGSSSSSSTPPMSAWSGANGWRWRHSSRSSSAASIRSRG
ncbi:MAG: hypothetical protein ACE5GW_13145, partial [Planctomycetota bacterium]